jgi:hypothetical protein
MRIKSEVYKSLNKLRKNYLEMAAGPGSESAWKAYMDAVKGAKENHAPDCTCLRCGYAWDRRRESRPRQCPACKQTRWDTLARHARRVGERLQHERSIRGTSHCQGLLDAGYRITEDEGMDMVLLVREPV